LSEKKIIDIITRSINDSQAHIAHLAKAMKDDTKKEESAPSMKTSKKKTLVKRKVIVKRKK